MRALFFLLILCCLSVSAQFKDSYHPHMKMAMENNNRFPLLDTNSYSLLNYSTDFPKAQRFRVAHFQKLNPFFNINLNLLKYSSEGIFNYQESKSHQFDALLSFNGNQFSSILHFGSNNYTAQENGGLENYDPQFEIEAVLFDVFTNSLNEGKNRILNFKNRYQISNNFSVIQSLTFQNFSRTFFNSNPNDGFYSTIYLDSTLTKDSTYYSVFQNNIGVEYKSLKLNYLLRKYEYAQYELDSILVDHGFSIGYNLNRNNVYWKVKSRFFKQSDRLLSIKAYSPDSVWSVNLSASQSLVEFVQNRYRSNHFIFNNHFLNPQQVQALLSINLDPFKLYTSIRRYHNFLYLDQNQQWQQHSTALNHLNTSLTLSKVWKSVAIHQKVDFNYSSNDQLIRLPKYSSYTDVNYSFLLFDQQLDLKLGALFYYFSAFYANAYSPALANYYLQNEQLIGDFPFSTVYASFQVESVNIQFKYNNIFDKVSNNTYYYLPNYPYYGSPFSFSINWKLN